MNRRFSEKFSSQWIKVKFYKKEPRLSAVTRPKNIRFCEAIKSAVTRPVVLTKENLSCPSAQYAFGWRGEPDNQLLNNCQKKRNIRSKVLESLLSGVPRIKTPFSCIGLNTDGKADLVVSFVSPQEMMKIINIYNNYNGKNLDVSLNSMMGLCANVAVKSFLEQEISVSFGCSDSRKFAEIGRDRLVVGIPHRLFELFI